MGRYDEVEVFETLSRSWVGGYEVAGVGDDERYLLRRQSDGEVLPAALPADRIRPAHSGPRG